jgi:hypothetical protein
MNGNKWSKTSYATEQFRYGYSYLYVSSIWTLHLRSLAIFNRLFSKSFAATKVENLFMFFKEANFGKRYELFLFIIYEVSNKNENRT